MIKPIAVKPILYPGTSSRIHACIFSHYLYIPEHVMIVDPVSYACICETTGACSVHASIQAHGQVGKQSRVEVTYSGTHWIQCRGMSRSVMGCVYDEPVCVCACGKVRRGKVQQV